MVLCAPHFVHITVVICWCVLCCYYYYICSELFPCKRLFLTLIRRLPDDSTACTIFRLSERLLADVFNTTLT